MTVERYPLTWPQAQPRTPYHRRREAGFKVDFRRARDETLHALELLGARGLILSSSVPLRQDGIPLAGMPEPQDPGVAVYFDRRVGDAVRPYVIACDSYSKVRWNLRAIGATVEALRSIQRHGASSMLEQAFAGFAALPPAHREDPWWEVLGVSQDTALREVRDAYLELVRIHHPDTGGDTDRMAKINKAWSEASSLKRSTGP